MSVFKKLNEARGKFHALKLEKTGFNKFAGYKYFELGDFLVPALKVFDDAGLCAVVSFASEVATMTIVDVDDHAHSIVITSPFGSASLKGVHEIQNIGAVETYQRRYLWTAALEIVEHDALDATTGKDDKKKGTVADVVSTMPELSKDDALYYEELAAKAEIAFLQSGIKEVMETIGAENLDNDQKIHLWARLGSKVRAAIKAETALAK